jgi:hypothetical protein
MSDSHFNLLDPLRHRTLSTSVILSLVKSHLRNSDTNGLIHPHGFYVFPLHVTESANWRLHVWPRGDRTVTGMPASVHTHDVDVDSRVLIGELTNTIYDVFDTSVGGLPLYEVIYQGDKYTRNASNILRKTDRRVAITDVSETKLLEGAFYTMEAHEFHNAIVDPRQLTVTLVRMHSRKRGAAQLVGLEGYPDEIIFGRAPCFSSDILELLGD